MPASTCQFVVVDCPTRISQNDRNTVGFQEVFVELKCSRDRLVLMMGGQRVSGLDVSHCALSTEYDQSIIC